MLQVVCVHVLLKETDAGVRDDEERFSQLFVCTKSSRKSNFWEIRPALQSCHQRVLQLWRTKIKSVQSGQ